MEPGRNDPCPCGSGKKYKQCCALKPAASPAAVSTALQQAAAHFAAQRWPQAEMSCNEVLRLAPGQGDALHILGAIAIAVGKPAMAAELLARAIKAMPAPSAELFFRQGVAAQMLGRHDAAIAAYEKTLALQPGFLNALLNLAACCADSGQITAAIGHYHRVLVLAPALADVAVKLASLLQQQSEMTAAEACLRQALQHTHTHLGALDLLLVLLQHTGRLEASLEIGEQALASHPEAANVLANMAAGLFSLGRHGEAVAAARRALAINPGMIKAWNNLAAALSHLGEHEEAVAAYRQALALNPDAADVHSNLLFTLQYLPGLAPQTLFDEHLGFARQFEAPRRAQWPRHGNDRSPERRLKIGYVSADFHEHTIARLIEPVLASHDAQHVEIFCYYNATVVDGWSERIRALAHHWRPCATLSHAALAEQIRADGIDILVDLAGHTAGNRLLTFACKPAPVQLTWMGYPGSTGLAAMDYRLTDALLDPPGEAEPFHTETLLRLPAWAAFTPATTSPPVNTLPALTSGQLTLACLNNLMKLNPAVIAVWAKILLARPQTRLLLGNAGNAEVRSRLLAQFAAAGIGPERLELLPTLPLDDYLALHQRIDLVLDPFPFTGGASSWHALWMGVPVLTLAGKTTIARQGAAILRRLELPQFVVDSETDYADRALALIDDLPLLNTVRQSLRERFARTDTHNAAMLTRALETTYADIWARWCAQSAS